MLHFNIKHFDPAGVVDLMADTGVTHSALSPAFAQQLCCYCSEHNRLLPTKILVVGGAPLYHHTVEDMTKAMVGRRLVIGYGSTEAEPISLADAETKLAKEVDSELGGHFVGSPMIDGGVKIVRISEDGILSPEVHLLRFYLRCFQMDPGHWKMLKSLWVRLERLLLRDGMSTSRGYVGRIGHARNLGVVVRCGCGSCRHLSHDS